MVIVVCLAIVGWGALTYLLVPERGQGPGQLPRQWDTGALPDVPAQSVYSTVTTPASQPAPPQIAPLPEAKPWSAQEAKDKGKVVQP